MVEISLQAYCEQIEDMIDQGRYAEAIAHGKHMLEEYPKYVMGYRLLGKAMLEARQNDHAADMFLRVLSADPEDMLAWVAMSEVHDRVGEIDAAVWYMERAFELSTDNELVGEELRQLYGRRDGFESERTELTRGALARLYLKGDLLSRAIGEFRALLTEQPERVDVEVALAEALWRNDQRLEATEVCQAVLDRLPYCLKANLFLGEIWTNSGREEGMMYLRRAEALDPENSLARELFGDASPLPVRKVQIVPLEYKPPTKKEERPAWMLGVEAVSTGGPPLTEREATLVDIAAALEAQIEIPSWLEEIDVTEAAEPLVPGFTIPPERPAPEAPSTVSAEERPDWLTGVVGEAGDDFGVKVSEQVAEVGTGPIAGEEEKVSEDIPDWLAGLGDELLDEGESPSAAEEAELPDFLSRLEAEPPAEEVVSASDEQQSDWLADLRGQVSEEVELPEPAEPVPADIPDWIQRLAPPEAAPGTEAPVEEPVSAEALEWPGELELPEAAAPGAVEEAVAAEPAPEEAEGPTVSEAKETVLPIAEVPETPPVEEAAVPAWLEGEGMPTGEEALAWLEQLAEGKEEELQAQVEAEIEARTAEIMGRPRAEEPSAPMVEVPTEELPVTEAPVEEAFVSVEEPVVAETPEWLQELAPETAPEGPSALPTEEAFGWTAFGELEAPPEAAPPVEEAIEALPAVELPLEEAPVPEVVPPTEEAFGWTAFGELEAPPEAAPPVEEAIEALPAVELPLEKEPVPEALPEAAPLVEELEAPLAGEFPLLEEEMFAPEAAPSVEGVDLAMEELLAVEVAQPPGGEEVPSMPEVIVPPAEAPPPIGVRPPKRVQVLQPSAEPFAAERAYLKEHPRDYEAWLEMARALWQTDKRGEALDAYGRLIRAGKLLDVVTAELEEYVEQWPDVATRRVLGDAYMKSDRLDEALALYRQALETL